MWTEGRSCWWPRLSPSLSRCGRGVDNRARLGTAAPRTAASPSRPHGVPTMSTACPHPVRPVVAGPARPAHMLLQRLLLGPDLDPAGQFLDLVVDAAALLHQAADLVAGVHHGGVVA